MMSLIHIDIDIDIEIALGRNTFRLGSASNHSSKHLIWPCTTSLIQRKHKQIHYQIRISNRNEERETMHSPEMKHAYILYSTYSMYSLFSISYLLALDG